MTQPLISIITVNYHRAEETCDMLDTLRRISYPNVEVILVDNAVAQPQPERFTAHFPGLLYLSSPHNLGFAGGTNRGLRKASGELLLLLNNDTLVPTGFLEPLVAAMESNPTIGIASPKIFYHGTDSILQYAGMPLPSRYTGRTLSAAKNQQDHPRFNQSGPTGLAHGAAMLIRRAVIEQIGLLPEDYFLYYEEVDYCELATQRGWKCYYVSESYIEHRESISLGPQNPLKTYYLFRNRWLFMRRRRNYWSCLVFTLYYLIVAVPLNLVRFLLAQRWSHAGALLKAVAWHLRHGTVPTVDRDPATFHPQPTSAHVAP